MANNNEFKIKNKIIEVLQKELKDALNTDEEEEITNLINFIKPIQRDLTDNEYSIFLNMLIDIRAKYLHIYYPNPYEETYRLDNPHNAFDIINRYYSFTSGVYKKNGQYKIYPLEYDFEDILPLHHEFLRQIVTKHLETNEDIHTLIEKELETYTRRVEELKSALLQNDLAPYYGESSFICGRIRTIIDAASKFSDSRKYASIIKFVDKFQKKYPENHDYYMNQADEFRSDYDTLEDIYLQTLTIEKRLSPIVEQMWQEYLTNPNEHDDQHFAYLAHAFTKGSVPPNEITKACCTLVTDTLLPIPYSDWGILVEYKDRTINNICPEDAGSWLTSKEEFVNRLLPRNRQITNHDQNVWYESSNLTKLYLPEDVERINQEINIRNNGRPLDYHSFTYYSEIFTQKPHVIGVFYTDNCQHLKEAKEYALKYKLPLVHLSLQKQRIINSNGVSQHINIA